MARVVDHYFEELQEAQWSGGSQLWSDVGAFRTRENVPQN